MIKNRFLKHWELVWMLAKTDFKLRYHGSILGYLWAILKPLFIFSILNFVFSSVIGRGSIENYSLQLITGIILWNFFAEGTMSGLVAFANKANLITKIYFPRWIIAISATFHSLLVFLMNLIILTVFFLIKGHFPSLSALVLFILYILAIYLLILSFALIAGPLFLKFRDLSQIWEVLLQVLFFAAPIIYPLSAMPNNYHKIILLNPMGIIIHYSKMILVEGRFPSFDNHLILFGMLVFLFSVSLVCFNFFNKQLAETI